MIIIGSKLPRVYAHLLDGAAGGAHAVLDPPPLEGGAGRARARDEPVPLPSTISPLVPMSMYRVSFSLMKIPEASTPATMSPPT